MREDELNVLDNQPLKGGPLAEIRHPYVYWLKLCMGIVLLGGLIGGGVSGYIFLMFYNDSPSYMEPIRMFNIYTFLGGLTICGGLLVFGCYRALMYSRKLESVTFLNPIEVERWHEAAPEGHSLWRICTGAVLALVIAVGPLFSYEGYAEVERKYRIKYQHWSNYDSFELDDVVEEAAFEVEEAADDVEDLPPQPD